MTKTGLKDNFRSLSAAGDVVAGWKMTVAGGREMMDELECEDDPPTLTPLTPRQSSPAPVSSAVSASCISSPHHGSDD